MKSKVMAGSLVLLIVGSVAVRAELPMKTVNVTANKGWQNTGLYIQPSDVVELAYESGKWKGAKDQNAAQPQQATGTARLGCFPDPSSPAGSLVAKIGN